MQRIFSGGEFEKKAGYCRAVVAGGFVHVAGTCCAIDPDTGADATTAETQCKGILAIIEKALMEAGSSLANVVRVNYYLPDRSEFEGCFPALRAAFGENPPAATMIECGLIDPKFRIEIEVTALAQAVP